MDEKPAKPDKGPTYEVVSTVNVVHPARDDAEREEHEQKRKDRYWERTFHVLNFLVAAGGVGAALWLIGVTKDSVTIAERPWVLVKRATYAERNGEPGAICKFKNFGKGPAFDVECRGFMHPFSQEANTQAVTDMEPRKGFRVLPPGERDNCGLMAWPRIEGEKMPDPLVVDCVILYRDQFGRPHKSTYVVLVGVRTKSVEWMRSARNGAD